MGVRWEHENHERLRSQSELGSMRVYVSRRHHKKTGSSLRIACSLSQNNLPQIVPLECSRRMVPFALVTRAHPCAATRCARFQNDAEANEGWRTNESGSGCARTLSAARELYAHTLVDVLAQVEHGALFLVLRLPRANRPSGPVLIFTLDRGASTVRTEVPPAASSPQQQEITHHRWPVMRQ